MATGMLSSNGIERFMVEPGIAHESSISGIGGSIKPFEVYVCKEDEKRAKEILKGIEFVHIPSVSNSDGKQNPLYYCFYVYNSCFLCTYFFDANRRLKLLLVVAGKL